MADANHNFAEAHRRAAAHREEMDSAAREALRASERLRAVELEARAALAGGEPVDVSRLLDEMSRAVDALRAADTALVAARAAACDRLIDISIQRARAAREHREHKR